MWPSSDSSRRAALEYVLASLFCALFAWVYEHYSHGVWSYPMVFAFVYPLAGGALPALLLPPWPAGRGLWRAGIAALTVGSLFRGALEIFGTTHHLTVVYTVVGGGLCLLAVGHFMFDVLGFSRYNNTRKNLRIKEESLHEDHNHQP